VTALAQRNYIGSTADVRPGHAFDTVRFGAWMRDAIPGFRGPHDVKQFEGGQSNPTFLLIDAAGERYVLRRKPAGVLLKSAHAVDREFPVMRALAGVGFPVAEPLALCDDEAVIGSMFYVMRHVPGRVFWNCRMPDLSAAERTAAYDSANEALARLHTLDVTALGLEDFGLSATASR
jgi:aminoglycoside phosphotransferase (APT) family kinase protein